MASNGKRVLAEGQLLTVLTRTVLLNADTSHGAAPRQKLLLAAALA